MSQERLSKDDYRELLEQWFHVVTMTQELYNSTRNFVRVSGDYLSAGRPLSQAMATWPIHIDRFERQYDKALSVNRLLGTDLVDHTHNRVQVFLHSFNTTSLYGVETVVL